MSIAQEVFDAKWVCDSFPKSGTHLLHSMVSVIAQPQRGTEAGYFDQPWAGTFRGNSWTNKRIDLEWTCYKLGRIGNGRSVKAHLGYDEELANFMRLLRVVHIFIYRDLRDVAVSQTYHIINASDERLAHPNPEAYPLDDFDEVLKRVIVGHRLFPGVIDRWVEYAPWLDVDWTMKVRFEDLRDQPEVWAENIFKFAMEDHASCWHREVEYDPLGLRSLVHVMAQMSQRREESPTFRRGVSGEWKEAFTEDHVQLWKEHDPDRWLVKLGYEQEEWYE